MPLGGGGLRRRIFSSRWYSWFCPKESTATQIMVGRTFPLTAAEIAEEGENQPPIGFNRHNRHGMTKPYDRRPVGLPGLPSFSVVSRGSGACGKHRVGCASQHSHRQQPATFVAAAGIPKEGVPQTRGGRPGRGEDQGAVGRQS